MGNPKIRERTLKKLSTSIKKDINEIYMCTEVPHEQPYTYLKEIRDLTIGLIKGLEMEGEDDRP